MVVERPVFPELQRRAAGRVPRARRRRRWPSHISWYLCCIAYSWEEQSAIFGSAAAQLSARFPEALAYLGAMFPLPAWRGWLALGALALASCSTRPLPKYERPL